MPSIISPKSNPLPSPCSRLHKLSSLGYLKGQLDSLNQMAYRYGMYLKNRTGITQAERQYAQYLVDMINSVDAEGAKSMNDLANDAFKELAKRSMKQ